MNRLAGRQRFSMGFMVASFLGVMTAAAAIYIFLEDYKMFRPVAAKQLPNKGQVHYTFEAAQ
jgi:NADH dehydrogenase (ubiquinone) 1 beta subcomplex subunit 8